MNNLHKTSSILLILGGVIHIAFTPVFYDAWTPDTSWFIGAGLVLIAIGLFNITAGSSNRKTTWYLCLATNLLGVIYGIAIITVIKEIQAYIGLALFILTTISLLRIQKL